MRKNPRKSTTTWWRHTYKTQPEFGLPDGGAAPHQAENEHHHADADDDHRGDQSVPVLDEAVKVVIALDHIGSDIGQSRPRSLREGEAPRLRADKWTEHLLRSRLQNCRTIPTSSKRDLVSFVKTGWDRKPGWIAGLVGLADPCSKAHGLLMQLYLSTSVLNEQIGRDVLFGAREASAADINAPYSSRGFSSRGRATAESIAVGFWTSLWSFNILQVR